MTLEAKIIMREDLYVNGKCRLLWIQVQLCPAQTLYYYYYYYYYCNLLGKHPPYLILSCANLPGKCPTQVQ